MASHRITACAGALVLVPSLALAQSNPPASPPAFARNTVFAAIGYSSTEHERTPGYSTPWSGSPGGALSAGHQWTPNFGTDVTLGWWRDAHRTAFPLDTAPAPPLTLTEHIDRLSLSRQSLALTATWRFATNAWIEPYVAGGVDLTHERASGDEETLIRTRRIVGTLVTDVATSDTFAPLPTSTTTKARLVGVIGAKAYVTPHAYLRGELRVIGFSGFDRVVWLGGAGFDF